MSEGKKIAEALRKLVDIFAKHKIDYVIYGGAALALNLGKLGYLEKVGDIDILLINAPRNYAEFINELEVAGFSVVFESASPIVLKYPSTDKEIEIFRPSYSRAMGFVQRYKSRIVVDFYGIKLNVRPPGLIRKDFISYIGEHGREYEFLEDVEALLKYILRLGLISAYKEKLGLAKRRRK